MFNLLIGLFSPAKYHIPEYLTYEIKEKWKNRFRELSIILNRDGDSLSLPLYFNGAVNHFEELPPAKDFKENANLYSKYKL